jgi:hypothetical protein
MFKTSHINFYFNRSWRAQLFQGDICYSWLIVGNRRRMNRLIKTLPPKITHTIEERS